jgi:chitodextrinase
MASGTVSFSYVTTDPAAAPHYSGTVGFSYETTPASGLFRVVGGKVVKQDLFRIVNGKITRPSLYRIVNGKKVLIVAGSSSGATAPLVKPLVGVTGADQTTFNQINTLVGPVAIRRTYNTALPASWSASSAGSDFAAGRSSVWGWHPDPLTFPTDTAAQNAFSAFLDTIPAAHKVWLTAKHEPENDIAPASGTPAYTLAQWGATITKAAQIVRGKNRPNLKFGPTFQGTWTFDTRSPYDTIDWRSVLDMTLIDYIGLDPYRTSTGSATTWEQMMTVGNSGSSAAVQGTMQTMVAWGKPVLLSEWGVFNKPDPATGGIQGTAITEAQKIAFIQGAYAWAKSWNQTHPAGSPGFIIGMVYFNLTLIGSDVMLSTTAQQQAYAGIVADSKIGLAPPADTSAPTAPTDVTVTNITDVSFKAVWPPASDDVAVTGYTLKINGVTYGTTTSTTLTVTGRTPGASYSVQVQAYDAAGNLSPLSVAAPVTMLAVAPDTTAPTAPGTPTIGSRTTSSFLVSWAPSTDAVGVTSYGVQLNGSTWGRTSGTSLLITGLTAATTYAVRVVANDAALNYSLPSPAVDGTTLSGVVVVSGPTWTAPPLVNPVTVQVTDTNHGLKLDPTKDYILKMPSTVLDVGTGNFSINGGRRVVLIGGAMTGIGENGSIRATNQIEYLHIEGLYVTGAGLLEGLQFQSEDTAIVQVVNCKSDQVTGSYAGHHADLFQTWGGGPKILRIDGYTGTTDYQGWMLQSGSLTTEGTMPVGWDFRRVNIHHVGSAGWTMYDADPTQASITMTEVYFEGNDANGIYSLGRDAQGRAVGRPGLTYGNPPGGDFVTTNVGLNYVPA